MLRDGEAVRDVYTLGKTLADIKVVGKDYTFERVKDALDHIVHVLGRWLLMKIREAHVQLTIQRRLPLEGNSGGRSHLLLNGTLPPDPWEIGRNGSTSAKAGRAVSTISRLSRRVRELHLVQPRIGPVQPQQFLV